MKKILSILTISAFALTSVSAQEVILKGDMQFSNPVHKVYLTYSAGGERITDSTEFNNGKFTFTEKISAPTLALLMVRFTKEEEQKRPRVERLQIYLEPGTMKVTAKDSLDFAKVTGSKSHKAFEDFENLQKPFDARAKAMQAEYREYSKAKDEAGMDKVRADFDKMNEEKNEKIFHQYLIKNPKSPIALYVLGQYAGYDLDPKKIEPIFESFPTATQQSEAGKEFKEKIETAKKTSVGAYAMGFTQNDTLGKPVSLSDFNGKYVLLDFWASWCGPCRAENPNVVEAFNKYKDNGFTVLGVSLDQPGKKQAWLDAIHKDNLTWTHVSDLKGWKNEVSMMYGVRAIPQNFLIGPKGKIIAKNIRGEELQVKLAEVFK